MVCPRCGKSVSASADNCPACGAGIAVGVLTPPPPAPKPSLDDQATIVSGPPPLPDADSDRTIFVPPADSDQTTFVPATDADETTFAPPADSEKTFFVPSTARPKETRAAAASARPPTWPSTPTSLTVAGPLDAPRQGGPLSVGQSFGTRYHIIRILGV